MSIQTNGSRNEWRQLLNIGRSLLQVTAFPVVLWTTRFGTWGSHYLTTASLLGLVWPLLWAVLHGPHPRLMDLFRFWLACVVLFLVHRITERVRHWRGYRCDSRYWGRSWLDRGHDEASERRARLKESILVGMIGFVAYHAGSVPLGVLLMIGTFSKFLTDGIAYMATEARLREMEEARIEIELGSGQFRKQIQ